MMRHKGILAVVALFLLFQGCDDKAKRLAGTMEQAAIAAGQIQENSKEWFQAGLISQDTAIDILDLCERVNVTVDQVNTIVELSGELNTISAGSIIRLLTPLGMSLDPQKIEFITNITDPGARQRFEGYLIVIRTAISSGQIILASVG